MLRFIIGDEVYFDSPAEYEHCFKQHGKEFFEHYRGFIVKLNNIFYVKTVFADGKEGVLIPLDAIQGKYFIIRAEDFVPTFGRYIESTEKGKPFGVPFLDSKGEIYPKFIPETTVKDIIEGYLFENRFYEDEEHLILIRPVEGKLYIDITEDPAMFYRWTGEEYTGTGAKVDLSDYYRKSETIKEIEDRVNPVNTNLVAHTTNTDNPHMVTKAQIGLGNVPNENPIPRIENLEEGKVDKVTGKQLSTEDYTTAEKNKLGSIVVENIGTVKGVTQNGTDVVDENSIARIVVPTQPSDIGALPDTVKYGSTFEMTIDSSTYVITASLKDQDGNLLGTEQTIDLPLESVVVSGRYDATTKKVILTLKNGSEIDFSVADLIGGLVSETTFNTELAKKYDIQANGIPKTDLANDVQTTLGKADSALQGTDVKDDLVSTDTNKPLSANQGKVLNEKTSTTEEFFNELYN